MHEVSLCNIHNTGIFQALEEGKRDNDNDFKILSHLLQ